MRPAIGWTLRETRAAQAVIETETDLVVDRGNIRLDYLYRFCEGEFRVEYAVQWHDPALGKRLYIFPNPGEKKGEETETIVLETPSGVETWRFGAEAIAFIDAKLAEWTRVGEVRAS